MASYWLQNEKLHHLGGGKNPLFSDNANNNYYRRTVLKDKIYTRCKGAPVSKNTNAFQSQTMNMIFFIQIEFKDTHNLLNALDAEQLSPDEQFYHQLFKMKKIIMHLGCLIKT